MLPFNNKEYEFNICQKREAGWVIGITFILEINKILNLRNIRTLLSLKRHFLCFTPSAYTFFAITPEKSVTTTPIVTARQFSEKGNLYAKHREKKVGLVHG